MPEEIVSICRKVNQIAHWWKGSGVDLWRANAMNTSVGGMIDIETSVPGMSENLGRIYAALQRQQYLAVNWSTAIETLDGGRIPAAR